MSERTVVIRTRNRWRRLVWGLAGLCMLAGVTVLLLPVWLPWVLVPGARLAGVDIGSYERVGYGRLALREVRFANDDLVFTADRIETMQPVMWAGRLFGAGSVARAGFRGEYPERMPLEARSWRLELPLAGPPAEEPVLRSLGEALDLAATAMDWLSWLRPGVDLSAGEIHYEGEVLEVRRVLGGLDRIEVELYAERVGETVTIEVGWASSQEIGTRFSIEAGTVLFGEALSSRTALTRGWGETSWSMAGDGLWGVNRWDYQGDIGSEEWWPATLRFAAKDWQVSLAPWNIPGYRTVDGGIQVAWVDETLKVRTGWQAVPIQERVALADVADGLELAVPPVSVELSGEVSFTGAVLDRLSVLTPGLTVVLDERLEVDWTTMNLARPGVIGVALRLDELGFGDELLAALTAGLPIDPDPTPLRGLISGAVRIQPGTEHWPGVILELNSDGFGWADWQVAALALEAELDWPEVRWSGFRLDMVDGSGLAGEGRVRIPEMRLDRAGMRLELAPDMVRPFLPEDIGFERILLDVGLEGEFTPLLDRLISSGTVEITELTLPSMRRLEPVRIQWEPVIATQAEDARSEHRWQVALRAADSTIDLAGSMRLALDERWIEVPIKSLRWQPGVGPEEKTLPAIGLDAPVTVAIREQRPLDSGVDPGWNLTLPEMNVGPASEAGEEPAVERGVGSPVLRVSADLTWPERGRMKLSLAGWNARWLRDWVVMPDLDENLAPLIWDAGLDELRVEAGWDGGPLVYSIDLAVHAPHPLGLVSDMTDTLHLAATLDGDGEGARLNAFRIEDSGGAWIEGTGFLPMVVVPGETGEPIRFDVAGAVGFVGGVEEREPLRVLIREVGEVALDGLRVGIEAGGSLLEPNGGIHVEFDRFTLTPPELEPGEIPAVTGLRLDLRWRPDAVVLEACDLAVAGQAIHAVGTLPLVKGFWAGLPDTMSGIDLAASHGRVHFGPIQLEGFRSLLPPQLRAQGEITLDARWDPGLAIGGALEFQGMATYPLPTSGSVQEIQGRIDLDGGAVRIEEISAVLGGRRMEIAGWVDLEPTVQALIRERPAAIEDLLGLPLPRWDIALTGDRIPVVRRPGMVIRTGLDIRATHDGASTPLIAGTVTPRESVFITDVRTMVPRGPAVPMPRPPFVQVDHPLIGDWRLNIRVEGDEFLRVRSPVFRGVLSVGMNVGGELREPVLVGDVMIPDGQLQFPFGNLKVTQGLVSLSQVDPTTPTLLLNAASRVYGYQITMNLSGTLESPAVVFSSIPPLASETILLMLSAGQLPRDELTFTAQQRATTLASYLGKTLLDSWSLEDPGEERLSIRSGESISVGGRVTYYLEYLLGGRWSLTGEYDEYDAMNAGVKYRLLHR